MHRVFSFVLVCLLLCLGTGTVAAQVNTGTILGNVTDPTGAAVANVKIAAVNAETGFSRTALSGADGSYLIPLLPISDRYTVTAEAQGFKTTARTGIGILLNQNVRVDIRLELGQVSERIEVSGEAPLVDTHSSLRGEVIETRRMTELPLNGRNPLQLASLVTGVTSISTRTTLDAGNRSANSVNVNGSRANETDYQLNGVRFAGSYFNLGLNYPNPDALEEFKLITNPNSAEYGMWSGSVFTAVMKSGTNEFHGAAFEFLRNEKLNARNFFAASKPTLKQNQFGISGGGPFVRNKLFGFGSYQGLRIRQTALASSFPLTPEERQGLITSSQPVIDPLSGQAFQTDSQGRYIIPAGRIDPVSKNILDRIVPAAPAGGLLITTGARKVDVDQYTGKIDWNISPSDQLYVSGLYDKTEPFNPFYAGAYPSYGAASERQRVYVFSISETHTVTPTLINDFRLGFSGQEELRRPVDQVTPPELGMKNWNYNYLPEDENLQAPTITVSGRFGLGSSGFAKWREGGQNWQIVDVLSWMKGSHTIRTGFDFYKRSHYLDANVFDTGGFTFSGDATGNATADFLIGRIGSATRIRYLNHPGYRAWNRGFFFQDDWKVHRRFTLNIGLRYDLLSPFTEFRAQEDKEIYWNIHGGLPVSGHSSWERGVQSTVFPQAPVGLIYPGDKTPSYPDGVPEGIIRLDKKQIQPRIGFAWDPFGNGKTSVRGSFGLFTNAQFVDMPAQFGQNLPFIVIQGHYLPKGSLSTGPYEGLVVYPEISAAGVKTDPGFFKPFLPASGYGWDPDYSLPRIMSMTFNVQRQIVPHVMMEAGYVGKLNRHLQETRNINSAIYIPGQSTVANTDSRRRIDNQNFQKIDWQDSGANASFHSFQATVRWQFARGLTALSSYTWSHSIDTWSTISIQSVVSQDPENTALDRGSADYDRRHVYRLSAIYDLPRFHGRNSRALDLLLGGWQLSGIMTAQSGSPFGLVSGRDYSLSGVGADRPDLVGSPYLSNDRSRGDKILAYFNTQAFVPNGEGRFGNFGRNVLTGPRLFNTDLGIFKNLTFAERYRVQFRSEFFNAFNQVHLGNPGGSLISPGFGRITGAGDPRFIQFALKFAW